MKKKFFAPVVAICALTVVSCTQSDESEIALSVQTEQNPYAEEFAKLNSSIDDFNVAYFEANGGLVTRSNPTFNFSSVMTSGAIGAVVGAKEGSLSAGISAAGFSIVVGYIPSYPGIKRAAPVTSGVLENTVFQNSNVSASTDSVGFYHNAIMLEAKKQHPEVIANPALCTQKFLTDDLFECATQTQIEDFGDVDVLARLQYAVTPVLSNTFSIAQSSNSSEQFLAQVMSAYPEKSAEFALIKQFIDNLDLVELSALNAHDYAQQILNLVNASELPQNIKDALIAGIEVSFASYELWNSGVMSVEE